MQYAVTALAALTMIGLVGVLISSFYFLDRLIRYEYSFYRDAWEQDGRPNGFLFRPRESSWWRGGIAFQRCALGWPLYTPSWIRADPAAKALHRRLRWCVLIWNVGFITWLLLFVPYLAATPGI
jgi:hypothetical protein